jgi:hypothetical protein
LPGHEMTGLDNAALMEVGRFKICFRGTGDGGLHVRVRK